MEGGLPFRVVLLKEVTGFELLTCKSVLAYAGGERRVEMNLNKQAIPSGDYVIIAAPISLPANGEFLARSRISAVRGAIVGVYGHTGAKFLAGSFVVNPEGTTSVISDVYESFLAQEHFRFLPEEWLSLIAQRKAFLPRAIMDRFELALGFIGRSAGVVDQIVRFSNAWIALEIMAGGKPDSLIKKITGDGQKSGVLGELDRARNDLFHAGVTPHMSPDAERALILAMFSDLLLRVGVTRAELLAVAARIETEHVQASALLANK